MTSAPDKPPGSARTTRGQLKRHQLLEAGMHLLQERGYHGTGIKQVLDLVQVPKGSFYNYFESKEDFVRQVILHCATEQVARLRRRLQEPAAEPASLIKDTLLEETARSSGSQHLGGCLFGNLAAEVAETSPLCRAATLEAFEQISDCIAGALVRGQQEGSIRRDVSARILADLVLHTWEGSLLKMKVSQSFESVRESLSFVADELLPPKRIEGSRNF